jgi:hypothetical protein
MPNNFTSGNISSGAGSWGLGGLIFKPSTVDLGTPSYNPVFTNPVGQQTIPNVTATGAGVQINNTTLDKTLNAILSGLALVKGANQIPTTLPANGGGYAVDPYQQAAYLQAMQGTGVAQDGTAAGKVENWVKQNTGVVLIGGAIVVALMMKPPTRR